MTETDLLRLGFFVGALAAMLGWETIRPFRRFAENRVRRLGRHLLLMGLNTATARIFAGGGALFAAHLATEWQWGLFHFWPTTPAVGMALSLILLDFALYAQHLAFHRIPGLWRLHRVHHGDLCFDTTTAIRFHPGEIVLSTWYKMALVMLFGMPAMAVLVFEILLNACALFNHGNVRLPTRYERLLRWLLITPDLHRIHHSSFRPETDSNFGFSVPYWDRLCRTYRAEPRAGQQDLDIDLPDLRSPERLRLPHLIILPWRRPR
ncbi:MAG TPA: sterol desaturase family protein [Methylococcus sp.]|nr:sterol desaturase family protein [Methylococcus sp.]